MKIEILGVKIDSLTKEEAVNKLKTYLYSKEAHYLVTPNPEFIMAAQKDKEFRDILNNASLALPDGFGLKLAATYLKTQLKERITGVDFIWEIARLASEERMSLYLFGAEEGIAEKAARYLKQKHPHLRIVSAESGLRNGQMMADQKMVEDINQKQPQILLVALGAPKQEKWIKKNLPLLKTVKIAMGVGGAFDFIAGRVPRAPLLVRRLGIEWLFRLLVEPWRFNRIITATFKFSLAVVRNRKKYG